MSHRTPSLRNWKLDLALAIGAGLGSILALTITGWPPNAAEEAWVGLAGLVAGTLVVFGCECIRHLYVMAGRTIELERQLTGERAHREQERAVWQEQLARARYAVAVTDIRSGVWAGAYHEALTTRHFLPLEALEARVGDRLKAAELDNFPVAA